MADRQTGSVWTHFDGSVLTGPLAESDIRLEIEPLLHLPWAEWLELHPDTLVLDWYPQFAERYNENVRPGRGGLGPRFQETILNWDDRLAENELVLGVNIGSQYRAYLLRDFEPGLNPVQDELNGFPLLVLIDPARSFGIAFLAQVDGQELMFRSEAGRIVDDQGNVWDPSGLAIEGPLAGTRLTFVTSFVTEWYGWSAYHPETTIFDN